MFHLIPAPLHRALLRLAHAVRRRWWRLVGAQVEGCRVMALDEAGRVLLIRHSYASDKWMPPGGGLGRGEDAVAAAARELREETGCILLEARNIGISHEDLHGADNRVHLVVGMAAGEPRADQREVIAARFFALDALPPDLVETLGEELPRWVAAYSSES